MIKNLAWFIAGALVCFALTFLLDMRQQSASTVAPNASLEQSLEALADAIRDAGQFVRGHQWYGSEREQAEAYRHILRQLTNALEGHALMGPVLIAIGTHYEDHRLYDQSNHIFACLRVHWPPGSPEQVEGHEAWRRSMLRSF